MTIEDIRNKGDVYKGIEWALAQRAYIDRPAKPRLQGDSASEHRFYADDLEVYEKELEAYKKANTIQQEVNRDIERFVEEYIKQEAGLNSVPEQYRSKVWGHAYENGHSYGHYEVYLKLCNLVDIFV